MRRTSILMVTLFFFMSIGLVSAAENDYTITIVLITDINSTDMPRVLELAEDGQSLITTSESGSIENSLLYSIPGMFDGFSTLTQNYTGYNIVAVRDYVALSDNGSKIIISDATTNHLYCFSDDDTTAEWSYDYTSFGEYVKISGNGEKVVLLTGFEFSLTIVLLNGIDGSEIWSYLFPINGGAPTCTDISEDGSIITVGLTNGSVLRFGSSSNAILGQYNVASDSISDMVISDDGSTLIAGSYDDENVSLFDISSGDRYWSKSIPCNELRLFLDLSSTGEKAVVGYYKTGAVSATEKGVILFGQSSTAVWGDNDDFTYSPTSVALNDDGDVIVGTLEGNILLLSRVAGQIFMNHDSFSNSITNVRITNNGTTAVALSSDGYLFAYRIEPPDNFYFWSPFLQWQNIPAFAIVGGGGATLGGIMGNFIMKKRK